MVPPSRPPSVAVEPCDPCLRMQEDEEKGHFNVKGSEERCQTAMRLLEARIAQVCRPRAVG